MSKNIKIVCIAFIILIIIGAVLIANLEYISDSFKNKQEGLQKTEYLQPDGKGKNKGAPDDADYADARREKLLATDLENGLFILVNKENPVNADYLPQDLVKLSHVAKNRSPAGHTMRKEAADAFERLAAAAEKEGHEIVVTTAYRSYDFQNTLYTNYVKNYGKEQADTFSARPGVSEHQTGLACDVSSPSVNYELTRDYGETKEGLWLSENAQNFGYIIRYPKGKEKITGYIYEPWHIRYVGKTAAKEIKDADITLEEYIKEVIEK